MTSGWTVVTHSAAPGGAELGLVRFLRHSKQVERVVLFEEGIIADTIRNETDVEVLIARSISQLKAALSPTRSRLVLSNTVRAAVRVARARIPEQHHAFYLQDAISGGYFSPIKRRIVELIVVKRTELVLTNSEYTRSTVPSLAIGKTHVVGTPSGIDSTKILARHRAQRPVRVLSLSRITWWKGIHVLCEAIHILAERGYVSDDLVVSIAGGAHFGEEEYAESIQRSVEGLPIRVELLGHVDDVHELLKRHDVLVHTSILPEPFGQVIVQGVHAGLITIVSDAGGAAEIAKKTGFPSLFKPGDASALADILEEVVKGSVEPPTGVVPSEYTDQHVAWSIDRLLMRFGTL